MCSWNYALLSNNKEHLDFHKIFEKDEWNCIQVLLKNERNGIQVLRMISIVLFVREEKVPVFKPCTFYFP